MIIFPLFLLPPSPTAPLATSELVPAAWIALSGAIAVAGFALLRHDFARRHPTAPRS